MTVSQERKEEQSLNLESVTWGDLTWVNVERPTEREIEYLAKNYSFHHLNLEDCLSRQQRPKLDIYEDYLFFIIHFSVYNKETRVSTHDQLSVFLGEKYIITVHSGRLKSLVELFRDCQINEEARRENLSYGSGYILYRILDRAVDAYFPILDKILSLIEDLEDSVFDENVESAQELASLRRNIITQRRILFPVRAAFIALEGKIKQFSKIDMSVHYGDLIDHMNKICETLDECQELIEVYKDSDYLLSSYRLSRITRVLAVFSAIVLPFLVISSLYGMNVILPGGLEEGGYYTFILLLVAMFAAVGLMLYIFRRRRLI